MITYSESQLQLIVDQLQDARRGLKTPELDAFVREQIELATPADHTRIGSLRMALYWLDQAAAPDVMVAETAELLADLLPVGGAA